MEEEKLKEKIDEGTIEDIRQAERTLHSMYKQYHQKKSHKWIYTICFTIVFGIIGYYVIKLVNALKHSGYDRSGIERICKSYFGDTMYTDTLPHELVVVAFEFNQQMPAIFTKWHA
jgi:uncharacterized protein (UPF0332 family)